MSLDEALLTLGWWVTRTLRRHARPAVVPAYEARLVDLRAHLTLVARALSGDPLHIQEAEQVGGYSGEVLYVPRSIGLAATPEENAPAYLYRVAYTVMSRQRGLTLDGDEPQQSAWQVFRTLLAVPATLRALEAALPMTRTLRAQWFPVLLRARPPWPALDTVAACLEALTQVLLGHPCPAVDIAPGWEWLQRSLAAASDGCSAEAAPVLWTALHRSVRQTSAGDVLPVLLWGQLMPAARHGRSLLPGQAKRAMRETFPTGTELPGKPKEHVRRVELDQRDIDHDVLMHTFDKIETAEEFQGVTRTPDGADELAQHAEA